ncbi:hypothetical protein GC105_10705 [Alkalibaculum sp. M08DMB]|uniref:Minor capsid protein n=1 Tax=Alkalibaculum sporogenes TaxID=2655001 RepID=A0A6A7KAP5_9FIRM|nr:putative minor capsid protein [Alkalibaculum sporogenes]MPW26257.1 hypothetical protein [Alkalibaculum sporogenes]
MRPIPKKVLIHDASHKYDGTKDTWGNITYPNTRDLKRVRIEPTSKRVLSKDNTEVQLNSLMFYDCVNSKPVGVTFEIGDAIVFGGATYIVVSPDPLYDNSKIHHYEIGLV